MANIKTGQILCSLYKNIIFDKIVFQFYCLYKFYIHNTYLLSLQWKISSHIQFYICIYITYVLLFYIYINQIKLNINTFLAKILNKSF